MPGGQQQLATQASGQVVPAQANVPSSPLSAEKTYFNSASSASPAAAPQSPAASYSSTQASLTSADKTNMGAGAPDSSPQSSASIQSQVNSYGLLNGTPSNSSTDDGFPVYYVSMPEEPNSRQYFQPISNSTINPSLPSSSSVITTTQSRSADDYPVYYVTEEENKQRAGVSTITSISSLPADLMTNSATGNQADNYPVYYVTSSNTGTPQAPKSTSSNNSIVSGSKFLSEYAEKVPVYNVGGPEVNMNRVGQVSKTEPVANSPVSYKIINSSSTSQDTTKSNSSSSPALAVAAPFVAQMPAYQPAATSYNYSPNPPPVSYKTASAGSSPSIPERAYDNYESHASPPSPVASSATLPASQPAPSYNGYPAYQASYAPSPVASSYPARAPAPALSPAPAPAPALATAPASSPTSDGNAGVPSYPPHPPAQSVASSKLALALSPATASLTHQISGVSSSPPFPPASQTSFPNKNKPTSSTQVSNTFTSNTTVSGALHSPSQTVKHPLLPKLEPEYENSSYIIATPPEKDTVLFLPSPSFPLSPDTTLDENSTSVSVRTNSSTGSISQQMNTTSVLNATIPETPVAINATNTTVIINQTLSNSSIGALSPPMNSTGTEITNFPIIRIPENVTMPGWELENVTTTNATFMSNFSLRMPSPTAAPENPISSTPPLPSSTTAPVALASSNTTVSGDTFNIPLGPLLNSLAVTTPPTTKPTQSQVFTTPPPKPAAPRPGTTKPPPVAFVPATKTTKKAKEWGFGDKYLGK